MYLFAQFDWDLKGKMRYGSSTIHRFYFTVGWIEEPIMPQILMTPIDVGACVNKDFTLLPVFKSVCGNVTWNNNTIGQLNQFLNLQNLVVWKTVLKPRNAYLQDFALFVIVRKQNRLSRRWLRMWCRFVERIYKIFFTFSRGWERLRINTPATRLPGCRRLIFGQECWRRYSTSSSCQNLCEKILH